MIFQDSSQEEPGLLQLQLLEVRPNHPLVMHKALTPSLYLEEDKLQMFRMVNKM